MYISKLISLFIISCLTSTFTGYVFEHIHFVAALVGDVHIMQSLADVLSSHAQNKLSSSFVRAYLHLQCS